MKGFFWKRLLICGLILPGMLVLSSCNRSGPDPESPSGDGVSSSDVGSFEDVKTVDTSAFTDLSKLQPEGALSFTFSDGAVTASAVSDSYEITGTALKIKDPGTYFLSGTCTDGSVTVAKETADVFLILDGLHLTSSTGPAITCNKSSSVCIYLQTGSENTLSDPSTEHEEGAALKFKTGSALILAGEGSLTVNGNFQNGIKGGSGSILNIVGGKITVTARNNALACDNYLQIDGGTLLLTAENDGIKASPDEGDTVSAGNIYLNGGTVTVNAVGDGISADGLLFLSGGTVNVTTTGEISTSSNDSFGFGGKGGFGGWGQSESTDTSSDASSKGIKAGTAMQITGGDLSVSSTDHALHCGGETLLEGGTLYLTSSKAKGIATHGNLTVSGDATEITVDQATEGIESKLSFTINGGTVRVLNASDDGINLGGTVSNADTSSHVLTVNGGTVEVRGEGDCIDSNGTITFNGGTVYVLGPSRGGNSCLDCQYGITYSGGTILGIATSSSMWSEDVLGNIDGDYVYNLSCGNVSEGDPVIVKSSDGTELISVDAPFSGQIGIIFMTDKTDNLTGCTFSVNGSSVTPSQGTDDSGGMGGMGGMGGFNPGGGDHGGGFGGPGGRR